MPKFRIMKLKTPYFVGQTLFDVVPFPKTLSEKLAADRERVNKSRRRELSSVTGFIGKRTFIIKINEATGETSFPKRNPETGEFE